MSSNSLMSVLIDVGNRSKEKRILGDYRDPRESYTNKSRHFKSFQLATDAKKGWEE